MATLIKEFHFVTDEEGWKATTTESTIDTGWFAPHGGHGHLGASAIIVGPPLSLYGGCFRFTAKQNTISSANYLELKDTTWEALGVPPGATVTNVQGDYLYKWDLDYSGYSAKNQNRAEFLGDETWAGPFVFLDDSYVLIDTFSTENYCIDRLSTYWKNYPTGGPDRPITAIPLGWGVATGANLTVPVAQQPSNSTITFRIYNQTPGTSVWTHGSYKKFVRMKFDYIVFTITYTTATASPTYLSLKRGNRFRFLSNLLK